MVPLNKIFDIQYGHSLELNKLEECNPSEGIAFVSRKSGENGIAAYVKQIPEIQPAPAGELTCALSGNGVLSTFIQNREFYTGYHVARLKPKYNMDQSVLLYYCLCITKNRYKYSWGRQANRTLKSLLVPDLTEVPTWVTNYHNESFDSNSQPIIKNVDLQLKPENWKSFRYDEIFEICKGFYNKKPPVSEKSPDTIPFIGATEKSNGITSHIKISDVAIYNKIGKITDVDFSGKIFEGNCITISNNGSVGEAFFQEKRFTCSHDVNPIYLKDKSITLNKYIAMFLCTLIRREKYRWGYGRKWRPIRMPNSIIKLPINKDGNPDWLFMENYIKSLNFSSSI
ncbi:restriction endonuclease subunit S [Chryseobacterium sp. Y16C]|nr:restriction endonuclease subunit S [Chryseobacterium sp. Y16C]UMQ43213.1 restriction endonuclease subunit S [Chryseobacterium sp. Y16C]